jgi:hypothetical protein
MRATRRFPAVLAAFVLALVSGQANAAEVEASSSEGASPWRGSAITYEHSFSALTLNKTWDNDYNPYYTQSVALMPMLSLGDQLYLRGNWVIEQELTTSDTYNRSHEIVISDLFLDVGATGWQEPETGVRIAGSLRLGLPLSKKSAAEQLYLALAPGLSLTRQFEVLEGLSIGYQGRYTYNFRKYATMQYDGPQLQCQPGSDCDRYSESGRRTAEWVISHGPVIQLGVTPKLAVFTSYTHTRARLYDLEDIEVVGDGYEVLDETLPGESGYNWRDTEWFSLGASYQLIDSVGVAVGVNTAHPQQQPDSEDYPRFFNRFTALFVDLNIDVDAVTKLF